jgi:hypothetical protein
MNCDAPNEKLEKNLSTQADISIKKSEKPKIRQNNMSRSTIKKGRSL